MTGAELYSHLLNRIEDPNGNIFTSTQVLNALNSSQKTLCGLIHEYYLSSLKSKTSGTVSSGEISFNNLFSPYQATGVTGTSPADGSPTVFTKTSHTFSNEDKVELSGFIQMTDVNGLIGVVEGVAGNDFQVKGVLGSPEETTGGTVTKLADINGSDSAYSLKDGILKVINTTQNETVQLVELKDFRFPPSTTYKYGSIGCVGPDSLFISPTSCTAIDVYFLKIPTEIENNSTECDLSSALEQILLDLAEARLFQLDNELQRSSVAEKRALQQIQVLNARVGEEIV